MTGKLSAFLDIQFHCVADLPLLCRFAAQEGFDSVMDCFNALQEMVIEDKRERESALREMARRMKEIQEEWQRNMLANAQGGDDSKAEGKTDGSESKGGGSTRGESKGDNDDDAKADSKHSEDDESDMERHQSGPPPAIMFFQPVSMDSLLSHVLSMTEYTTFSTIMRTKVRQAKLLRVLERRVENHKEDAEDRDEQLKDNSIKGAVDVFEQLVERVCGLTPHQEALKEQVRSQVSVSDWSEMLESGMTENLHASKAIHIYLLHFSQRKCFFCKISASVQASSDECVHGHMEHGFLGCSAASTLGTLSVSAND